MIIDTDVLIWLLRGNVNAQNAVKASLPFDISAITYMELVQGMNNKHELASMKRIFGTLGVNIIPVNEQISNLATSLVEQYALSHSLEATDALIAATCIINQYNIFTANDKHYRFIPNLNIKIFRP